MTCDHARKRTEKARAPFFGRLARPEEADRRGRLSADGKGWETKLVETLPKALAGSLAMVEEIEAALSGTPRRKVRGRMA
jgi:hypothetical protein